MQAPWHKCDSSVCASRCECAWHRVGAAHGSSATRTARRAAAASPPRAQGGSAKVDPCTQAASMISSEHDFAFLTSPPAFRCWPFWNGGRRDLGCGRRVVKKNLFWCHAAHSCFICLFDTSAPCRFAASRQDAPCRPRSAAPRILRGRRRTEKGGGGGGVHFRAMRPWPMYAALRRERAAGTKLPCCNHALLPCLP